MNKAKIDNKIVDVIEYKEYLKNPDQYTANYTGIVKDDTIYPIRNKTDNRPGFYDISGTWVRYQEPPKEEKDMYSINSMIRFDDVTTMKDIIEKQNQVREMERSILTSPDNLFVPVISKNDTPEMAGFKQAIINKKIDINKYEQRFGDSFNNDKRLFNGDSITLGKIKSIGKALDIRAKLVFEDISDDVPNPMGEPITVSLTGGNEEDD